MRHALGTNMAHKNSGYCDCACRDCFDIAISDDGKPALCGLCADAGCDEHGGCDCERSDAYDTESEES
jgi:hypothetical protein